MASGRPSLVRWNPYSRDTDSIISPFSEHSLQLQLCIFTCVNMSSHRLWGGCHDFAQLSILSVCLVDINYSTIQASNIYWTATKEQVLCQLLGVNKTRTWSRQRELGVWNCSSGIPTGLLRFSAKSNCAYITQWYQVLITFSPANLPRHH